jgi:hypothetical protein
MPRPTAAQFAYGSATVVCSTLVMLLLSGTTAGLGIAVIGIAALALGLLVAVTVSMPRRTKAGRGRTAGTEPGTTASMGAPESARLPGQRPHAATETRVGQPSLRR